MSFPIMQQRKHAIWKPSLPVSWRSPDDESSGISPKTASSSGASGMDLILRVSGPCYIRHR